MPSLLDLSKRALDEVTNISLETNTNPYLYKLHPGTKIVDGDTLDNSRLMGFDTGESSVGTKKNEKAKKLISENISADTQKRFGLAGKAGLEDWVAKNPNAVFERRGMDVFGRELLNNPQLTEHMVSQGLAVPTDRYDPKMQNIYRATQEKIKQFDPERAKAMEIQREYNIGRQKPGFLKQVGDTVDALQSGTQQALAGAGDFILDVLTPV